MVVFIITTFSFTFLKQSKKEVSFTIDENKYIKEIFESMTEKQRNAVFALVGIALSETQDDIIKHHGVLGMKWGVRRYQNYDGSYTKKGLARYKNAELNYEKVKAEKQSGNASRKEVRVAKRKMSDAYDKLKSDKMADEGKKLYSQGKTITTNNGKTMLTETAVVVGVNIVSAILANSGNLKLASISGSTIALGGTAINAVLSGKTASENKKLRAYYFH